ncbi:MAG: hypothetical protein Ct9H300mP13_0970 [Gammaproteobacteria bacterium]|nr:MAG: hypothetical protein Ct9H300mP13_0970 [Gammaproteobacteria bacterium]
MIADLKLTSHYQFNSTVWVRAANWVGLFMPHRGIDAVYDSTST